MSKYYNIPQNVEFDGCNCTIQKKEPTKAPDILDPNIEGEASEVRDEDEKEEQEKK